MAMLYTEDNPLMLEEDYAYTAKRGECNYSKNRGFGKVTDTS